MNDIDGLTLQFMANMNHYQKYIDKNEASKVTLKDLEFYHQRFLNLTHALCDERIAQSTFSTLNKTCHSPNSNDPNTLDSQITPKNNLNITDDNHSLPSIKESNSSSNDIDDVHQDVQDAFNRFVDSSIAFFRFSDRNSQLQKEYDGLIPHNDSPPNSDIHDQHNHNPFDVTKFQIEQAVGNEKTCTLDTFISKRNNHRHPPTNLNNPHHFKILRQSSNTDNDT